MSDQPDLLDKGMLEVLYDAIGDSTNDIIKLYLQDVPNDLQTMRKALQTKDFATLRRLAHSLKSSSANLGAMQTSASAKELEDSLADGEIEPAILQSAYDKVVSCFDQTRSLLENWQAHK